MDCTRLIKIATQQYLSIGVKMLLRMHFLQQIVLTESNCLLTVQFLSQEICYQKYLHHQFSFQKSILMMKKINFHEGENHFGEFYLIYS